MLYALANFLSLQYLHAFYTGSQFYSFSFLILKIFCSFFHYPFLFPVLLFSISSLDFIFPFVLDLILFFISWHSLLLTDI